MAKQWNGAYLPNREGDKIKYVYVPIAVAVDDDDFSCYVGDLVDLERQNEIVEAWKWLVNGVKDRNLLDEGVWAGVLYTGVSIDDISEANRRTTSDLLDFNDDDILIGIGANVVADGQRVMLVNAFDSLGEYALENQLKNI